MKKILETKGIELILFSSNEESPSSPKESAEQNHSKNTFKLAKEKKSKQNFKLSETKEQQPKSEKKVVDDVNDQLKREFVQRYLAAA